MDAILKLLEAHLPPMLPALFAGFGVAVLLGGTGRILVPMVRKLPASRWRDGFLLTAPGHPILAGALFGLSPNLPVPPLIGDSWEASILWYALAGVASLPAYRWFMGRLERKAAGGEA